MSAPKGVRSHLAGLAGYGLMLGAAALAFHAIARRGAGLVAPDPAPDKIVHAAPSTSAHALEHVLLALAVVILLSRLVGALFKRLHQPAVIGEVVAGIMLGPSLLGRFAPGASAALLPQNISPLLGIIAQVGVVLFMFLIGLELDVSLLKGRTRSSVAVSHASILTPFTLGGVLALFLYPVLATNDVPFLTFALFIGVSMSVTAFPVLARILTDRRMQQTRLGTIALTCAAVDDVTAWCLLAFVVSIAQGTAMKAAWTVLFAGVFVALMLLVVRPLVRKLVDLHERRGQLTQGMFAVVAVGLLLSALATEAIGIHALFGAFLFGALIPRSSRLAHEINDKLTDVVIVFFLPAFFAFTGLRTQIGLVSTWSQWLFCGVIILVATLGKFGGSFVAARLTGLSSRDAASLGILMNTRGLMELIVLNVGFDLGVISPTLFAMLVLMALVTTFATTPILHLLQRHAPVEPILEVNPTVRDEPHG
ncbi:MAG: cation:proton antiporter [Polyangiaceae bacterium]